MQSSVCQIKRYWVALTVNNLIMDFCRCFFFPSLFYNFCSVVLEMQEIRSPAAPRPGPFTISAYAQLVRGMPKKIIVKSKHCASSADLFH